MAFIGNTNTTQAFTPAIDYFSGTGSATAFTLSRPVASVAQVQAVVNNVAQNPSDAFTVSGSTITFTSAPSTGTNNIYVYYTSPITQVIAPGQGTVVSSSFGTITDFTTTGNTVLGDATTDTLTVGVTGIVKDSSGNVGIGTASPTSSSVLDVVSGGNTFPRVRSSIGSSAALFFQNSDTGTTTSDGMYVGITSAEEGVIWNNENTDLRIATNNTERMRIDSSGNVLIGQTTGNADARTSINGGSTDSSPCIDYKKNSSTTTTAQVYARFTAGSTGTGSITANGAAAAAFTAWSDRRLKENITDLPSQLASIMALRPVEFDYVESMGGGHQIGFIAQDVQAIYPDLVGESADGMLTLTDMNKNDARLIKAIQELKAINDTQAATITALTARIVALENK